MSRNSAATAPSSAETNRPIGGSDMEKVDAHRITFEEYLEIPELDDSWLEPIEIDENDRVVRRGRPRKPDRKRHVSLRLSPDVLAHFKARGPGWQTHVDDVLRAAMSVEQDAALREAAPPAPLASGEAESAKPAG